MILEYIVSVVVASTGMTCAAHDNAQNKAVYAGPNTPLVSTTYTDRGNALAYRAAPARQSLAMLALRTNERAMQAGKPGRKVRVQCVAGPDWYRA